MGAFGSNPTFSVFPDGRALIFNPDGDHGDSEFDGDALIMDGMLARPLLYTDDVLVLLYFNFEDEVFGSATVWSRVSHEPKLDHDYETEPSAGGNQ
jgi:hypothetical protein